MCRLRFPLPEPTHEALSNCPALTLYFSLNDLLVTVIADLVNYLCVLLGFCVGVWHRPRPWAFFCRWPEKSGLCPLLQIQKKVCVQGTPFHYIQWDYTISNIGPMGNGSRVCGGRCTSRRCGGVKAVRGGKGCNEGGV